MKTNKTQQIETILNRINPNLEFNVSDYDDTICIEVTHINSDVKLIDDANQIIEKFDLQENVNSVMKWENSQGITYTEDEDMLVFEYYNLDA